MREVGTAEILSIENLSGELRRMYREIGAEHWYVVRENVFALPHLDKFILFLPLQGACFLITRNCLAAIIQNRNVSLPEILEGNDLTQQEIDKIFKKNSIPPIIPQSYDLDTFKPCHLTISPTTRCQLKCRYCYIHGGENPEDMEEELARSAVRFCLSNAVDLGKKEFQTTFIGQGEATLNWNLFTSIISYSKSQCHHHGLNPKFSIVTNGMLSERKINFLSNNKFNITLSMDGFRETTDFQRPRRDGKSTFSRLMKTIDSFEKRNMTYWIRVTVTKKNISEMERMTKYFADKQKCRGISFEPMKAVGRASTDFSQYIVDPAAFEEKFQKAKESGAASGIEVNYSACNTKGIRSSFCGAYGHNLGFCLNTGGLVSSCVELMDDSDPRASFFIYGRFNREKKKFVFNPEKIRQLRQINVTMFKRCRDCFAKWNCGGNCLSEAVLDGTDRLFDQLPLERCQTSINLIKNELVREFYPFNNKKEVTL